MTVTLPSTKFTPPAFAEMRYWPSVGVFSSWPNAFIAQIEPSKPTINTDSHLLFICFLLFGKSCFAIIVTLFQLLSNILLLTASNVRLRAFRPTVEIFEQPLTQKRTLNICPAKLPVYDMATYKDPAQCFAPIEVIERLLEIRTELGFRQSLYLIRSEELTDIL